MFLYNIVASIYFNILLNSKIISVFILYIYRYIFFFFLKDSEGAAVNFRKILADDGSIFLIEPMAGETFEANNNLVGKVFSGFSPTCCLQCAKATAGGAQLGTLAPTSKIEGIFKKAGFSTFKVIEAPKAATNRVFQVKV